MERAEYLTIRNNTGLDTTPVLHFYFELKGGSKMSLEFFRQSLSLFLQSRGLYWLYIVNSKAFYELDRHFNI